MIKLRSSHNIPLFRGLFWETSQDPTTPTYTLKDQDREELGRDYPSLYKLYLAAEDPTEYEFARKHIGSWSHWTKLCECIWFKPYIDRWRKELELKLRARAIQALIAKAKGSEKDSFLANKFLIEKGLIEEDKPTRGRPKKAKVQVQDLRSIDEDFKRLETIERVN